MSNADIGLIGLAVMGQNLVLNMENHGYRVAVYNRTTSKVDAFIQGEARGKNIVGTHSLEELVQSLAKPRKVMLMVQAGRAVDAVIDQLTPLLEPGDLIIDGGNSFYQDTIRRANQVQSQGLLYLGTGVSGGEEGALKGPSIMPGGTPEAWTLIGPTFQDISAHVDGDPCCIYLGANGVGHFVKMVHNGIEYGDMQLITEVYFLMKELLGMSTQEMAGVFAEWNKGPLESYLIEITADILTKVDRETGKPMVDVILDAAGHKGTGKWTSQQALDLGIPAPTITDAVYARYISAQKDQRVAAAQVLKGPSARLDVDKDLFMDSLGKALYAAKICSYAQGFALMDQAASDYEWDLDLGQTALIWRGGCIIRAQFLNRIKEAYMDNPDLKNLLLSPYFRDTVEESQASWRTVVSTAALSGLPVPGLSSALAYYDSYRMERLPANLLQAQRDYFGAHTYRRTDKDGVFHTEWLKDENGLV